MDKLSDVRQVKIATIEAASRIVAENLSRLTTTSEINGVKRQAAEVTIEIATALERHVWRSGQAR